MKCGTTSIGTMNFKCDIIKYCTLQRPLTRSNGFQNLLTVAVAI
jgi:hypothetical protein